MRRFTLWSLIGLFVGAALPLTGVAWGDVVVNDRGRRFEGEIVRETSAGVTLRLSDGSEVMIPTATIRTVERAPQWQNHVRVGEQLFQQGDFQGAQSQFEQALQAEPPSAEIQAIRQRIADAQDALSDHLSQQRERDVQTIDDLLSRAETQSQAGDHQKALETLDEAERLRPSSQQEDRLHQLRVDTLYARAYARYDRLDTPGALAALDDLFAVDPNHQQGLDLYNQIIQSQPIESPETVAEIERILEQNPDRYDLQARVGEYYSRRHEYEKALPFLLAAANSNLYLAQIRGRLRQAMLSAVERATQTGDYAKAIELYQDVLSRFPNEDENYLNSLIYHYQDRQLAPDDLEGRVRLAVQCKEAGYDDWAREQMDRVLAQDPNNAGALALKRQFAQEAFDEAAAALREENYTLAQILFQRLIEQFNFPDLNDQAQLLMADAQRRSREQQRRQTDQARSLVDRGDEYFATAQSGIRHLQEFEFRERQSFAVRGVSTRETIIRNLRRAIDCFDAALQLDPSLGPDAGGGVLVKRADARDLLDTFTNPTFPRREPAFSRN
jgi:tetratricopeptide (TPR) repeat protein